MNFSRIKTDLVTVYDALANYWGQDKTLHDWGEEDLVKFARLVGKGAKVLDLGCASGYQSKLLKDEGLDVVGLDLSPKMIAIAKKRVPNAKFVVGDMTNLSFKRGTFDGIFSRASLLHIPKKLVPKTLESVCKILIINGVFYLAVKDGKGERRVDDERHGMNVRRFFSFFKEEEIKDFLEKAGFQVFKLTKFKRDANSTLWLQVFARKI